MATGEELEEILQQPRSNDNKLKENNSQRRQRYWGRPVSQAEVDLITKTTEADLMTDLIRNTVAKAGPRDRKTVEPKIIQEQAAVNSNQNAIRAINELDKHAGGVWEGTFGVITSNFGHVTRSVELLRILGIKDIVGLSAEEVLRHFGYNEEYLNRYESLNVDPKTLKEQERWRRAVQEEVGYVLHDVQFFENDERLMQVMSSLKKHYGEEQLSEYGLDQFEDLIAAEIRKQIRDKVDRPAIVKKWLDKEVNPDEEALREEIYNYSKKTEKWLKLNEEKNR